MKLKKKSERTIEDVSTGSMNVEKGGVVINEEGVPLIENVLSRNDVLPHDGEYPNTREILLFSWDAVPYCAPQACTSRKICPFVKAAANKCQVIVRYLKAVNLVMERNILGKVDEATQFRIGMHLTPLYVILCKLKIEEAAKLRPVKKGSVLAVYKEIRETIKVIEGVWKSLGLTDMKVRFPESDIFTSEHRGGYYERMVAKHERRMKKGGENG